jgi:hypothetical protein
VPIFRKVLGKVPSNSKARVRNFIANREIGTQSDIHENVISPGVVVPWHYHETEEVIVVLEGDGLASDDPLGDGQSQASAATPKPEKALWRGFHAKKVVVLHNRVPPTAGVFKTRPTLAGLRQPQVRCLVPSPAQ